MPGRDDLDQAEALARWLGEQTGSPSVRFEKVEPGDEQILPPREQRELDALPSALDPAAWTRERVQEA